jgi:DNA-binding MarR family transcriptional regulator
LEASGLVESNPVGADRRVRGIRLSRKERDLVQPAKSAERAVWPVIEAAVAHACKPLKGSLLEQLAALGAALERISLQKRAADAEAATSTPARRRRAR